jgi:hypothetical protein
MPEPIRPGIKKAVTPNIGITAFYIKSQQTIANAIHMSIQTYEILSHALFLYIYGIRRSITQTYNFQAFVGGVHKIL